MPDTDPAAGWVFIRSTVEYGTQVDEEWMTCRRFEWDAMTEEQRNTALGDVAVNHQNNVAPCGASEVTDRGDIPDDVLAKPEGHLW